MKNIKIGGFQVGRSQRPLVIAEAGINHNGNIDIAKEMIKTAKSAGADIIKFQTHIADAEMIQDKELSGKAGSHVTRSLYAIMKECGFSFESHKILQAEAEKAGILFLSTPFSIEAVELLEKIHVPAYKVGSGEVTNIPFLKYLAKKKKPVILSTGTADWKELFHSVEAIKKEGAELILMQCTSNYPTDYANVNLGVMTKMEKEFDVPVGLSDHCMGNYACFGAAALGACMVEKHFTLSRKLPGIDQKSSIEPDKLKDLIDGVRAVWEAMGDKKELNEEAKKVRYGFSESIVSVRSISAGEILKEHVNIWVKRPGSGIPSYRLPEVSGKKAKRNIPENTVLVPEDIADFK